MFGLTDNSQSLTTGESSTAAAPLLVLGGSVVVTVSPIYLDEENT